MDESEVECRMTPREEKDRNRESTPGRLAETNPLPEYPSRDYTFPTMQAVLEMQRTLGGVETSIKHLENKSKEYGDKLEQIGKDMHAAKIVGGFIVLVAGFLGFVIHELIPFLTSLKPH
jgi:hypothetical protein